MEEVERTQMQVLIFMGAWLVVSTALAFVMTRLFNVYEREEDE
jgi:hypothetical protein